MSTSNGPERSAREEPGLDVVAAARDQVGDVLGLERPILADRVGDFAVGDESAGEQFVVGDVGELQVFDRMAEGPVADVVEQGGDQESLGVGWADGGGESFVRAEPGEKFERDLVDAE